MDVQNRKRSRHEGQAMVRTVLVLGTVTAGATAYVLSGINAVEAVVIPCMVLGLMMFGIAFSRRARKSREWSAAWNAYAELAAVPASGFVSSKQEILQMAGTN